MAEIKLLTQDGLNYLIGKIDEELEQKVTVETGKGLSTNDYDNTEKQKLTDVISTVEGLVSTGGQANVIETVKVNGTILTPTEKTVNIDLSAYALKQDIVSAMDWKGTKATYAELPTSGNAAGDVWHVTADGGEYAWDGTTWQSLGTIVDLSGYSTTTEVNSLISSAISGKANSADVYTKSEVDTKLNGKANTSHTHGISDVSGLQDALNAKVNVSELTAITNSEIDALFA